MTKIFIFHLVHELILAYEETHFIFIYTISMH